jgi:uncharacterized membrane protein
MRYSLNKGQWPTTTIVIISILFTPVIGSILAAINLRSLGAYNTARKYWIYAAISLGILYYTKLVASFAAALFNTQPESIYLFPQILFFAGILFLPGWIGLPYAIFIYLLVYDHHYAWIKFRESNPLLVYNKWGTAYIIASCLLVVLVLSLYLPIENWLLRIVSMFA